MEDIPTGEDFLYEAILALKENQVYSIAIGPKTNFHDSGAYTSYSLAVSVYTTNEDNKVTEYDFKFRGPIQQIYYVTAFKIIHFTNEAKYSSPIKLSTDTYNKFIMLIEDYIKTPISEFDPSGKFV